MGPFLWALAAAAHPAPASFALDLPPAAFDAAIIALAEQTDLTIGGADLDACAASAPALHGRMGASEALRRLLEGSRCTFDQVGPSVFRIRLRPERARPPPVKPATPPETSTVSETVVTAYRRPELLGHAPTAVSVIPGRVLAIYPDDLASSSALISGFAVTNLGPGRDKIILRGLSDGVFDGRTQSTVGLYLDDTPIQYDAPDPDLLLVDMSRVEILKGPQGSLYGEGSVSGVVRMVTNPPELDRASANVTLGGAATLSGAPSTRVVGTVNAPLINDVLAVRATVYDDRQGGYLKDLALGQDNINSTQRYGGRIAFKALLQDHWDLVGAFTDQQLNSRNSQYVSGGLGALSRRVPIAEPHDNDFDNAAVSLSGDTGIGALKIAVNELHHTLQSQYDADPLASRFTDPAAGPLVYEDDRDIRLTTAEATLASPNVGALRWLAGVFTTSSVERFSPRLSDAASSQLLYSDERIDHVATTAGFAELTVVPAPSLSLTAGGRLSDLAVSTNARLFQAGAPPSAPSAVLATQAALVPSGKLVATYTVSADATIYAQAADGFRGGGFNTDRLSGDAPPPTRFGEDRLTSYEFGVKLQTDDRRGALNVTGLYEVWRNIQSDQIQASGLPMTVNVGDGRNIGVEAEGRWAPDPDFEVRAQVQLNNPRLLRAAPPYSNLDDPGLPFIASANGSLGATWRQTLGGHALEESLILAYRGQSHLNFGPFQEAVMGGYTTLDLAMTSKAGPTSFTLRLDNALNARANTFAYGNPFTLGLGPQQTPLRPATVWLSAAYAF